MSEDLFVDKNEPERHPNKKMCLACRVEVRVGVWVCAACRADIPATLAWLDREVLGLEAGWRALLAGSDDDTQARFVALMAAASDAYAPGENRHRASMILRFKKRVGVTINRGDKLARVAAAWSTWNDRVHDLRTVVTIAAFRGEGVEP
jgi:hypothetical protein